MKKLLSLLAIIIITLNALGQNLYTPSSKYGDKVARAIFDTAIFIPTGCGKPTSIKSFDFNRSSIFYDSCGAKLWVYNPKTRLWANSSSSKLPGGPISSLPAINNNPGTDITSDQFILSQYYASQPPTVSITGGGTYEYTTPGRTNRTLSWSAGRQNATATLSTIIVDAISQSFMQPALSASVTGTKVASVQNNTNTTYTNTVTTTDGKTANATTTFYYQNKIYAGFVASTTPTDAEIIAATGSVYVGGTFSGSRNQSGSLSIPSSSKYIVFVTPANYGTPNVVINGLGVTYNLTTRSFTNASGGASSYTIAVSPFPTAGGIDSYLVN